MILVETVKAHISMTYMYIYICIYIYLLYTYIYIRTIHMYIYYTYTYVYIYTIHIYIYKCICIAQYTYASWPLSAFSYSWCFSSPSCVSPIITRQPSFIFAQYSWGKCFAKKLKCSHLFLVTKHEQTHELADRMIRFHKFHTDLE